MNTEASRAIRVKDTTIDTEQTERLSRRSFLQRSALTLGGLAVASGALQPLTLGNAHARWFPYSPDYGPLFPTVDKNTGLPLLLLPKGFRYVSYGWTGDLMSDGTTTPPAHDGMAVCWRWDDKVWLVRNHEVRTLGTAFGPNAITYDPLAGGGTSNLVFDMRRGRWEAAWPSISGTNTNCCGGPTPWGSWLTCEETLVDQANGYQETHGWVFDVPAIGKARPLPLKSMGRFVHEACAVHPKTGIVYETEDRGTAGFYRFLPNVRGKLSKGGRLEMLRVVGWHQADLRGDIEPGSEFPVDWVAIQSPEQAHNPGTTDSLGVYTQGFAQGAATFSRLEGAWFHDERIYFTATSGGIGEGQVWQYNPRKKILRLIYASPAEQTLDNPDNLTLSPHGGILLCEDGDLTGQRLIGLTKKGEAFPFAQNSIVLNGEKNGIVGDFRGFEWAGATFSPDGKWLFVNIQTPGVTFAITGPWDKGALA